MASMLYVVSRPSVWVAFRAMTRMRVRGRSNVPASGPLLVVANHLSVADPPLLGAALPRPVTFMAKEELFRLPGGLLIRALGAIPVRRTRMSVEALRRALRVLRGGGVLGVFPEGKRSRSCHMEPAEFGTAFIALRSSAPVLPVGIFGSENLERLETALRRPSVTITIGEPFSVPKIEGKITREQLAHATDVIMSRIANTLPPSYRGYYGHRAEKTRQTGVRNGSQARV